MTEPVREGGGPKGVWLGVGVALSTATQLRPGIPLGPGEVLLAGWLVVSLASAAWANRLVLSPAARAFGGFWAASFVLLLAGLLVGAFTGLAAKDPYHDLQAYCLAAAVITVALAKPGGVREVRRAVPVAMGVSTVGLALIFVATFPAGTLGPLKAFTGHRFMGWSANPNQLALAMCTLPFLALYGLGTAGRRARLVYWVALPLSVVVGLATFSDSVVVAWAGSAMFLAVWGWLRGLARGRVGFARGAALYVVVPAMLLGVGALTAGAAYRALEQGAAGIYSDSGQGDLRLMLWQHGLMALGASPLVGLGPGGHSGYTGPFEDFEAHNTYIDWASATGLGGVVVLALLLAWTARRTGGDARLLAALLALLVVSVFGFYMRHPTFWFYLAAIALLNPRREPAGARSVGPAPAPERPQPVPAGGT